MAYQIDPTLPARAEMSRIAVEQIDKTARDLDPAGHADGHAAVHEARKRFKKLRGLLLLMRGDDSDLVRRESAAFRDAARGLSASRDRTALIEALDGLAARFPGEAASALAVVRTGLELKRDAGAKVHRDGAAGVEDARATLDEARRAFLSEGEAPSGASGRRALLDGLAANYRRARRDLSAARAGSDADVFHDLRKRVKYHAMHLRLLAPAWPQAFEPLREAADVLAEDLGRDHDYAVLAAALEAEPAAYGSDADRAAVVALAGRHGQELRRRSLDAAGRLFTEKTGAFRRRIGRYLTLAAREAQAAPAKAA